jgi:hypothetical protein
MVLDGINSMEEVLNGLGSTLRDLRQWPRGEETDAEMSIRQLKGMVQVMRMTAEGITVPK